VEGGQKSDVPALESILIVAQHQDSSVREASSATRSSIATVLGFDGVLIGLAAFAAGNVASGDGALVGSSLLTPFAIFAGIAILALTLSALVLLVALIKEDHVVLDEPTRQTLMKTAEDVEEGKYENPTLGLVLAVKMLLGEGMIFAETYDQARRQRKLAQLGFGGTAFGILALALSGIVVVTEVLCR
jgi:hypothetical protein